MIAPPARRRARRRGTAGFASLLMALVLAEQMGALATVLPGAAPGGAITASGGFDPAARASACISQLGCGRDLQAATDLEQRIQDNFWYGLTLPIDYNTPQRIPGDVKDLGTAWGDAGLWSGTYLAAESFRYALAREKLRGPEGRDGVDGRAFWRAQQSQAKARIDAMLAQVDVRTNIARAWRTQFRPSVGQSGVPPPVSFGGGVVQGQPGMLMFSCAPAGAPQGRNMPLDPDVRGPWHWSNDLGRPSRLTLPEGDYVCEASTTRDAYAGTLFGLLTAFDLVAPDDPDARTLIRDDVLSIADFLLDNGWNYVHPHGNVSLPPFGDVYDNFVTPIMVISPTYRLGVSQAARHVAMVAGPTAEAAKWNSVWAEEFATQSPSDIVADEANDPTPTAGYFGWNLAHLMYFDLVRLAATPQERDTFRRNFSIVDRQTSDDVNAFFESVVYSMTGERSRLQEAVQHLGEWIDYRAHIDQGGTTDNTARCGVQIACVPEDQYDVIASTPAGDVRVTVPGRSSTLRAVDPLPVADRPPTDFLWQRSPFTDMDGSVSAAHQEPGIDYLLPYWMLRYYTELAPPRLHPLPVWPGPAYSGT